MIKISFCLPVYNVEKYINNCLDSIEAQNLENNEYEIICIDDCSTDNSYNLLLERENKNIKILKNDKNYGLSYTRNRLLEEAKGEYIWFIDSDDLITKNSAKLLLNVAEENDVDIVLSKYKRVYPKLNDYETKKYIFEDKIDNISSITNNILDLMWTNSEKGDSGTVVYDKIYKKSFLDNNNLFFDTSVTNVEDILFSHDLIYTKPKSILIDYISYIYVTRQGSITQSQNWYSYYKSHHNEYLAYNNRIEKYNLPKENIYSKRQSDTIYDMLNNLVRVKNIKLINDELKNLKNENIFSFGKKYNISNMKNKNKLLLNFYGFWYSYFFNRIKDFIKTFIKKDKK